MSDSLIEIEYGSRASSQTLNNNFNYLNGRIDAANVSINNCTAYTDSKVASLNSTLRNVITTSTEAVSGDLTEFETEVNDKFDVIDSEIDELKHSSTPIMIPIVDWEAMQSLVTSDIKITNTATGITYYAGNLSAGTFKQGDLILKEDFTNYQKIMVTYTIPGSSGSASTAQTQINSNIIDSWELNYTLTILPDANVRTNILNGDGNTNVSNWSIFGYNREESSTSAKTTKKYFYCNNSHSQAGIIEIYGLTNLKMDVYIVSGSTEATSGWLSDTADGEAITPAVGVLYTIKTEGTYLNKHYRWDGNNYIEVTDAIIPE